MSPAIIYINTDLASNIISTLTTQLYLTSVITKAQFDANVAADGYYTQNIHLNAQRVMVMGQLNDFVNRNLFDIVLFAKNGLVSVEQNLYGPHGLTVPMSRVYLTQLFTVQPTFSSSCPERPDLDDGFVDYQGNPLPDDDCFEAFLPSPQTDPPYPGTDKSSF